MKTWTPNEKEMREVMHLNLQERFSYFIKRIAQWDRLAALRRASGWATMGANNEALCFPVWPHAEYAKTFVRDEWDDCSPEHISIDDWLEKWTPGLTKDGILVAVFPVSLSPEDIKGVIMPPAELAAHIKNYLQENF